MASQGKSTALQKAAGKGNETIEAQDADFMTPLQVAVHKNKLNVACILIEHKADVEAQYKFWAKAVLPIFLAVSNGNEAMVRLLVDNGADIEESSVVACGLTPIGVAAKNGSQNVFTFLLEKDANIEAKDSFGCTPLFWAAQHGHKGIIVKLLQHGARTNVRTRLGGNKSLQSVIQRKPQIAHLFQQYGQSQ